MSFQNFLSASVSSLVLYPTCSKSWLKRAHNFANTVQFYKCYGTLKVMAVVEKRGCKQTSILGGSARVVEVIARRVLGLVTVTITLRSARKLQQKDRDANGYLIYTRFTKLMWAKFTVV